MRGWRQFVAFALVSAGVGGAAGFREDKVEVDRGPPVVSQEAAEVMTWA
jgi:hypothetical protein